MDPITEDYLACKGGDKDAMIRLYMSMKDILIAIAMGIVNDRGKSEDIVHDVFLQIMQSCDDQEVRNAKSYMIRMTRNRSIDYIRNDRRLLLVEENSGLLVQREVQRSSDDVSDLLNRLQQEEAEVIRLRVVGELRYREIAAIMGVTITKAFHLYRRGITKLRKQLKSDERS